jgi:hypothetical protein
MASKRLLRTCAQGSELALSRFDGHPPSGAKRGKGCDGEAVIHHPFEDALGDAEVEAVDRAALDPDEDLTFGRFGDADVDEAAR